MKNGQWWEKSWNPIDGCQKISEGCRSCWAESMAKRFWKRPFSEIIFHPDRLEQPFKWKKPRRIFVCSMGDLFHDEVKLDWIDDILGVIRRCPQHTFMLLTKRPNRMMQFEYPKNVWLGITTENRLRFEEKIRSLLYIPSWKQRWLSIEPLLGPINLHSAFWETCEYCDGSHILGGSGCQCVKYSPKPGYQRSRKIGLVVTGCESGQSRRPMKLEWAIDIVKQCDDAGVPVFVKQIEVKGKVSHDPREWPEQLRRRELP